MPPIINIAGILFSEFIIVGYHIMMPWGFVLAASVVVVVLMHAIIVKKKE